MKLFRYVATFALFSVPLSSLRVMAQFRTLAGSYEGTSIVHGQSVPVRLEIGGTAARPTFALLNGPDRALASAVTIDGNHLVASFGDFARTFDATLAPGGKLSGSFGTATVRYPVSLVPAGSPASNGARPNPPDVAGIWEIQVKSAKGESAWTLDLEKSTGGSRGFIQRIDGDTGALYGSWTCPPRPAVCDADTAQLLLSHFTDAGPALYRVQPQPDGTLLVSNLLRADLGAKADQQNLVARRPAAARAANLAAPTAPTEQTVMKNPAEPLVWAAPDLTGHTVSSRDPQFDGRVVLVTVGGSWCPNCHDEAPDLEALYKRLHSRGLEIVNLSFEEEDQLKDPVRLRAFIQSMGITYTVLLAGVPDQLNEKLPQAEHLNCWPTSFLVDRTGHVREIHAGFSGPATGNAHTELVKEITRDVEELLAEPVPSHLASLKMDLTK